MKRMWILTSIGMVCMLMVLGAVSGIAADRWTYYINPGTVQDIAWYDGSVWCATEAGLYEWDVSDLTYTIHTANDGLPHNNITTVKVAPGGTIWAGTDKGGLGRYEGGIWTSYSSADGLPYDRVASVAAGSDGSVWIGTYVIGFIPAGGGISWRDGDLWQSASHETYTIIEKIVLDSSGIPHMIGSSDLHDQEVLEFDGVNWTVIETPESYYSPDITVDATDMVWLLTRNNDPDGNRVYRRDGDIWTAITSPFDDAGGPQALATDPSGTVWCASSNGGLAILSGDEPSLIQESDDTAWLSVFTVDDQGTAWAGTTSGGLARYVGGEWTIHEVDQYDPGYDYALNLDNHVLTLDRNGILYASGVTGLYSIQDGSWVTVSSLNDIPVSIQGSQWGMVYDQDNTLWTYSEAGEALYSFDGSSWETFNLNGVPVNSCTGVLPAENGKLWITLNSDGKLYEYDIVTATATDHTTDFEYLRSVLVDSNGAVWCVEGDQYSPHLARFNNGNWQMMILDIPDAFEWQKFTGFIEDSDGNIWFSVVTNTCTTHHPCYDSRVFKYDGVAFTKVFESNEYLSLKEVDESGAIWLSAFYFSEFEEYYGRQNNGIVYYNGETTRSIKETDGLASNMVLDIIDYGDGSLFIATDKGICQYQGKLMPVGVEDDADTPVAISLINNYPNPFNPTTTITYTIEQACQPELAIYSITGQKIRSFNPGRLAQGQYSLVWDGTDESCQTVSSGVYICRMKAGGAVSARSMTLVR